MREGIWTAKNGARVIVRRETTAEADIISDEAALKRIAGSILSESRGKETL